MPVQQVLVDLRRVGVEAPISQEDESQKGSLPSYEYAKGAVKNIIEFAQGCLEKDQEAKKEGDDNKKKSKSQSRYSIRVVVPEGVVLDPSFQEAMQKEAKEIAKEMTKGMRLFSRQPVFVEVVSLSSKPTGWFKRKPRLSGGENCLVLNAKETTSPVGDKEVANIFSYSENVSTTVYNGDTQVCENKSVGPVEESEPQSSESEPKVSVLRKTGARIRNRFSRGAANVSTFGRYVGRGLTQIPGAVNKKIVVPVGEYMKPVVMKTLTGDEYSKRPFSDCFLGWPNSLSNDDGTLKNLDKKRKAAVWISYALGGFLLRPLQSVIKLIVAVPFEAVMELNEVCQDWIEKKKEKAKTKKSKNWFKFLSVTRRCTLGVLWFLAYSSYCLVVRPIVAPFDALKGKVEMFLAPEKTDEDRDNRNTRKVYSVIGGVICVTVTTAAYAVPTILTAGLIIPLVAPTVTVPVLSAVTSTIVGGLTTLFGGTAAATTAAVATAITAMSIPVAALGARTLALVEEKKTITAGSDDDSKEKEVSSPLSSSFSTAAISKDTGSSPLRRRRTTGSEEKRDDTPPHVHSSDDTVAPAPSAPAPGSPQ